MWLVKYCGSWNYRPQAESLSAQINQHFPDTCEIEEGSKGQFELFRNGESFLNVKSPDYIQTNPHEFFTYEDVKEQLTKLEMKSRFWSHLENGESMF